ncbi:MAG: zinc ribbon domain-containing protein [Lachnospiraceae bacterium]|nr:zinc ribbon domain-containing protein [Lachnospiraceae bacterium]
MYCNSCGSPLPDGSGFCTICGANQPQNQTGYQRPNLSEWRQNEAGRQHTRTSLLLEPLQKICKYKMIVLILGVIALSVTMAAVKTIDHLDRDSAYGVLFLLAAIGIACIVIEIMLLLTYKKAGQYDSGFETVYKTYLTYILLGVISNVVKSPLDTIADIAQLIFGIAYVYYLYRALADVVRPVSGSTAGKWDGLFKFYIVSCIVSFISIIYAAIKARDEASSYSYGSLGKYVGAILWILVIAEVISFIISIVEVVYLKETTRKMEIAVEHPNGPDPRM